MKGEGCGERRQKNIFSKVLDRADHILSIITSILSIRSDKGLISFLAAFGVGVYGAANAYKAAVMKERVLTILLTIAAAAAIIGWSKCFALRKKWKAAATEAETNNVALEKKGSELTEKDAALRELSEKAAVLEKAFRSTIPPQVGFYVINKEEYDKYKTELQLIACTLEVRLTPHNDRHNMKFTWTLDVKNNNDRPATVVHFIFSGEKDLHPKVTIKHKGTETHMYPAVKLNKPTGDDCFIEITLANPIDLGDTATIIVDYTSSVYQFRSSHDTIWLAPDALGFANVSKFCIRIFHDQEIIAPGKTNCILRTYRSSGKYSEENDQLIDSKGQGKETVFECVKNERDGSLHEHAYLLVLINDWDSLPLYLQDMTPPHDSVKTNKTKG